MDIKPVGQLKPVETGVKPVGQLKPIQSNLSPIGQLKEGDANTVLPKYNTPQDLAVDSSIELLKQKGGRNGTTVMDSEWDVLKDVLKDPRATKEQREKAILTIQGYDAKHDDNNTMYYNKLEENGVYVPTALAYGEKPPKGYKVASVWGNQEDANDDSWYTDLGKSLANGVLGAAEGVIDLTQVGTTLVTGEESKYLNKLGNTAEVLKFNKDESLNAPILNTEGITQWSDLLDKDRFDLSPKSLWGTLNMAAESLTSFAGGTSGAMAIMKNSPKAAIFTGSFITQLGGNLDAAEDAGLKGRDKAAVASAITAPMAALDAFWGLDGKLMSQLFRNEKKELLKNVIKSVEKDAAGNITENGFKQLTKQMSIGYSELAKRGTKAIVKDVLSEGGQEAAQDFAQKAGEQLWDKLTPDERGQFGTDAFDAKSFGDYINSFATGLVSGAPMAVGTQVLRNKHDEQSINAYERVKQGPEAIKALKGDLDTALKGGDINQAEYEQANFKIDAYNKYNEETKSVNLKPEDEKKAFELSFQIQGLKTEIPTNENEISKLDPIARAKVESKQKQAKELQSELNDIIRQGEIKGEPVVPKKEEERVQKEKEKEAKANEKETKVTPKSKAPKSTTASKEPNPDFPIEPKMEKKPEKAWITDKRTYEEIPAEEWNHSKTDERLLHKAARKHISKQPGKEVNGQLYLHQYEYNGKKNRTIRIKLEDGKILKIGSSKIVDENGLSGHFHTERLKGNLTNEPVGVKVVELAPDENGVKKQVIKIYQKSSGKFLAYVKETHTGQKNALDKNGNPLYTESQISGELEDIKLQDEKPLPPDEVERLRNTPIAPIMPKTVKEKAKEATDKIVEESKAKVESARLTNQVSKSKTVDTTNKNESEKEEYLVIDKMFSNGNTGTYQSPKTPENKKYSDYSSKGWKVHIQFDLNDAKRVAKFLLDNNLYFKVQTDAATYVNTMTNAGATIYVGGSENTLDVINLLKSNLSDTLTNNKNSNTVDLLDGGKPIYSGSGSDIAMSDGIAIRFDVQKSEFGTLRGNKKYESYGFGSYLGNFSGISFLSKDGQKIRNLEDVLESKSSQDEKIKALQELEKLHTESLAELEKDFGKDFVGIEKIINARFSKDNSGDNSVKKEPTAKKDNSRLRRKIVGYNRLSKEQKKSEFGVNLRNEIQKEAEDFGGSLKPLNKGKVQLLDSEGKQVKKASVKREQNVIDEEKALAKKTKDALDATPTSLDQYIAIVVGRGGQFDKSITKEIPDVPSLMKNNKGDGYSLESLYDGYKEESGLDNIDEKDFAVKAENIIGSYLTDSGREDAIKYAIEAYEKDINGGKTDKELADMIAYGESLGLKEQEVSVIDESVQNLNEEEVKELETKIENTNEKDRNEESANRIIQDIAGEEGSNKSPFDEMESEQDNQEGKDIVKGDYADDVFQKSKKMPLLNITNISSSNLALKENGINGRLLNEKQVSELQKEIEGNYVSEVSDLFNNKKDDLRQKAYNYDNPIAEKDSNGVNLRIAEGLIRDKKKTYLLYADGKIVGEFGSVQDAKNVVKYIEDNLINKNRIDLLQKESANKGKIDKVVALIKKALPKVNVVFDENLEASGKWSPSKNTITVNPLYAGLDTPIHEGGHILIDAMGYNNRIIQAAIKQLRDTDLYKETKKRYPELSDEELDKEVLAEAIGREGADIFDKVEDRSKFKAYLDYIFDWLKQKLGMDKNIAKSLAKQIIGGVKTKNLEGKAGKEQLQKADESKKKNPLGARPLRFDQYASEHGFSYEKETEKIQKAKYELQEALDAEQEALVNGTQEEHEEATKEYELAKKAYAIAGKRDFEYKKYRKDFNAIQKLMAEKEMSDYTTEELQDLISMLHGFDNKAAKAVRNDAMTKLAMIATKKQQEKFKENEGYIEDLAKTKDISPLQSRILHHSHFTENNPDMQAVSLEFGNAVMDKILDANSKKTTHEKLGQKVITEENKRLGIIGATKNRFSSDSAKYFNWMENENGELLTVKEAEEKGLSEAKINYLKFTRETIADYKGQLEENDFDNSVMDAIRIDKGFMEAYKSEGLLPAFSYYLGGGANNLGKVRIVHNGQIKSYSEIEKEILSQADRKSVPSMAKALWDLLVANIQARRQLKKGFNIDEAVNPLELKGEAEYSLNEKGQLVSKFDKPRAKDRGYSKDFYKAMNQFIDESAHVKHISKIMPLVDSVEYLNKNGYMEEGYVIKPNVAKWIEDWKKLHIFKEPHVNDPILDASIKAMRKLVASTTMWFNIPANVLNVFMGNYSNWRQENAKTVALGNKRLFGGSGKNRAYGLDIIKKYNIVNQDYDSNATMKYGAILSKLGTIGTQIGEYQIQGSLGLGLLSEDEFNSFEYTKDKYGNEILTVKPGVDEKKLKEKMTQVKNRITDIQGKYPDEDRRNIMKGEIGKAAFQFKVWIPDFWAERFSAKYYNAYGVEREGTFHKIMREGLKQIKSDINKKGLINAFWENEALMSNIKGLATIATLLALKHQDDDDDEAKKGSLNVQNALSQVLFILDPEQLKYMLSNPVAALGKSKDLVNAVEALLTLDEEAYKKVKRVLPANKVLSLIEK